MLTPHLTHEQYFQTPFVMYLVDICDTLRYVLLRAERTQHAVGGFRQSHGGVPGGRHAHPRNTG